MQNGSFLSATLPRVASYDVHLYCATEIQLCELFVSNGTKQALITNYYDGGVSPPSLVKAATEESTFRGKKGALFTLALFGAKVKAIAA